jgi:hypothetical protein
LSAVLQTLRCKVTVLQAKSQINSSFFNVSVYQISTILQHVSNDLAYEEKKQLMRIMKC